MHAGTHAGLLPEDELQPHGAACEDRKVAQRRQGAAGAMCGLRRRKGRRWQLPMRAPA